MTISGALRCTMVQLEQAAVST